MNIMEGTTRQTLMSVLRDIGKGMPIGPVTVANPERRSNLGTMLHRIFLWQEMATAAEQELKHAWTEAQAAGGICDNDDQLRQLGVGQSEVCSSRNYAMLVDVKTPAQRVDGDLFLKTLAKRFKTTVEELERIQERCRVDNRPALTKKVVERV